MKVNFRGKEGFIFTEAIENYIREKLKRISHFYKHQEDLEARVVCSVLHEVQTIEITIPSKHLILRAEVSEHDLYTAIDLAIDKLESQIRRHKDKINSLYRQREGVSDFFKSDDDLDMNKLEAEIIGTNLVKNKKVELTAMTADEAAMHMELIDHDFYIFLDKVTDKVSIIYRREKDNDYAVIQTD